MNFMEDPIIRSMMDKALEEAYNNGELPRELMFAHELNVFMRSVHGNLQILKGMLDSWDEDAYPDITDLEMFKNLFATMSLQAGSMSDGLKTITKKYPDVVAQHKELTDETNDS